MTEKLYDKSAYLSCFKAVVLSCERTENGYKTALDKTVFFPESGGQASDKGLINNIAVFDVQIENGVIYHYTKTPFNIGERVKGEIDFPRRFSFMQNHTAEHIISGIVNRIYGFDNVGFHLGEDYITLDFNGILDKKQLEKIEYLANECVWQNLTVKAYYPKREELEKLDYRSKKEIAGKVRIVEIENTDFCACCAPHVAKTGEIGLIKLLETERMRGGTRIFMKSGSFALADYRDKYFNISEISALLSAKKEAAFDAVLALDNKLNDLKRENSSLKKRLIDTIVKTANKERILYFEDGFDIKELQLLADSLNKTYGGIKAVFSPSVNGFSFAICGDSDEALNPLFNAFKSAFSVKGGGRNGLAQGSVSAKREEIKQFFEDKV